MMINAIRGKTGLTQVGFAKKYGIPVRTLQDWEAGRRNPPEYILDMLAYITASEQLCLSAWVFTEYRNARGHGHFELFNSRDESIAYAKRLWNSMPEHEKRSYLNDPAGEFYVAKFPVEWSDEEECFVPDFRAASDMGWDALVSTKVFNRILK